MINTNVEIQIGNKTIVGRVTSAGSAGTVYEVYANGTYYERDSNGSYKEKK